MATLHFLLPGDIDTPTGGYGYDRRLIDGLREAGWEVSIVSLPGSYPFPNDNELSAADDLLSRLPDGSVCLVDGLAFGVLDEPAARHGGRLRLVALVHHPLGDEGNLARDVEASLLRSEREALRHASAVICTSATTGRRLVSGFGVPPERLAVAPPGTDRRPRAACVGDPPVIVSLGAVVPRKGHDVLLEALARVADRPWSARIVGAADRDLSWVERLRQTCGRLALEERVVFTGAVHDPDAELAAADIFALATRHEGYGMAFAEALAHGLPVVGCAVGAVPEVVPAEAGVLVPPDDPEALAAALAGLLDDPAARHRLADGAWQAGQRLPRWEDTAAIVARTLKGFVR